MSFAPLAARLAAHVAVVRPVEGSRDTISKLMALVVCAVLEMLILVCEMLDARAALGARPVVASIARVGNAASVPAPRAGRQAPLGFAPKVRAVTSGVADVSAEIGGATRPGPWLAWSRDTGRSRPCSPVAVTPPQKSVFPPTPSHVCFVALS